MDGDKIIERIENLEKQNKHMLDMLKEIQENVEKNSVENFISLLPQLLKTSNN